MMNIPQDDIASFVLWLGTAPALQLIITRLLPRWGWFNGLQHTKKLIFVGALALLLPQLSLTLTNIVPPATWAALDPNFRQLMMSVNILLTWAAGEAGWQVSKRLKERRDAG